MNPVLFTFTVSTVSSVLEYDAVSSPRLVSYVIPKEYTGLKSLESPDIEPVKEMLSLKTDSKPAPMSKELDLVL